MIIADSDRPPSKFESKSRSTSKSKSKSKSKSEPEPGLRLPHRRRLKNGRKQSLTWIKLQRGLLDEIESYAVAVGQTIPEAMLDLWRFALSVRLRQLEGKRGEEVARQLGLPLPEELEPLTPLQDRREQESHCRVCGNRVPPGYHFCPPEEGQTSCYFEYNNDISRKICIAPLEIPPNLEKGIKIYALLEGFALDLDQSQSQGQQAARREGYEMAMRDLWKFALEIRLPQLGLKTPSKKFQPARYTIEQRRQQRSKADA